jgi:hypothetical protein
MPVTEPSRAVFLSYASQDAWAAQRICEALRGSGIEVWFDQSELRGGDGQHTRNPQWCIGQKFCTDSGASA